MWSMQNQMQIYMCVVAKYNDLTDLTPNLTLSDRKHRETIPLGWMIST